LAQPHGFPAHFLEHPARVDPDRANSGTKTAETALEGYAGAFTVYTGILIGNSLGLTILLQEMTFLLTESAFDTFFGNFFSQDVQIVCHFSPERRGMKRDNNIAYLPFSTG
jgi:hypothetical protein